MCYSLGHCRLLTAKCLLQVLSYILFCLFLIEYPVCLEHCLITRGNINSNSHRLQMKLLQITFKSFFFGDLASTFLPKVNRCHKTIIEFHSFPWWSVWLSVMLVVLDSVFCVCRAPMGTSSGGGQSAQPTDPFVRDASATHLQPRSVHPVSHHRSDPGHSDPRPTAPSAHDRPLPASSHLLA